MATRPSSMLGLAGLALGLGISAAHGQLAFPGQAVAVTGRPVYGSTTEAFYSLSTPTISSTGIVGFGGQTIVNSTFRPALFRWHAGQGSVLARAGDPYANHPLLQYQSFGTPIVDDAGRFVFHSNSNASGISGYIHGAPGQFSVAVLAGTDPNPNPSPGYLRVGGNGSLGSPLHTRSGTLAFQSGSGQASRTWSGTPGNFQMVADYPSPAPGYPAGTQINGAGASRVDDAGRVFSMGTLTGAGMNGERALVLAGPQGRSIPVGPGRTMPGIPVPLLAASRPGSTNGSGRIGFEALFQEPGGPLRRGAWTGQEGAYQLVALTHTQAPGMPAGTEFVDLDTPRLNHAGDSVFRGYTPGPGPVSRVGLWVASGGTTSLAVGYGMPVVNMPAGSSFVSLDGNSSANVGVAFNDLRQIALTGTITIPGGPNRAALLVDDPILGLQALAITGLPYQLAPGDSRIVQDILTHSDGTTGTLGIQSGDDGFGTFLNDSGGLVYGLVFTDGSQATIVTQVPAPGTGVIGLTMLAFVRRRRR